MNSGKSENKRKILFKAKTYVTSDDVEITKIDVMQLIRNNQFHDINEKQLNDIFERLDEGKNGRIKRSVLLDYICSNNELARTSIKDDIQVYFQSESEKIFSKLRKLKKICINLHQKEAVEDIDWIIETLTNNELNEPDFNEINSEEMEVLKGYSRVEQKVQRDLDIKKVTVGLKGSTKNIGSFKAVATPKNERRTTQR